MTTQLVPVTRADAQQAIDSKTKPLGALGRVEEIAVRLAVLQGTLRPTIDRARICVFGADHGVTDEGVSAYPRAVTAEMMKNFARGGAAINVLAASNGIDVEVIDVGVDADLSELPDIHHAKVRRGSHNFVRRPAMELAEVDAALAVGADAARRAATDGVQALGLGEMGIGNTTAAAALLCAFTGRPPRETVGRGTGVDDEGLTRKADVVGRAIAHHGIGSATTTAVECLRCVGGLEIAAIAGAALEASRHRMVVVADGFISTVAVLCAISIAAESPHEWPMLGDALFFSHRSNERGHLLALDACAVLLGTDATPLLDLGLRLGEGTGVALALPLIRSAAAIMRDMATFESAGVSAGDRATEHSAPVQS
ncbi:MAG TPA: nicotinate-nucleotide--dimethylbenzimidazole phosphoribosyltransferase [Gemmatimonadaceae bacterium]|jgi:nicotinate-nucleotide--dimethylbenzimidazole phosphoribosyltransferase